MRLKGTGESLGKAFNFGCAIGEYDPKGSHVSSTGSYNHRIGLDSGRNRKSAIAGQNARIDRLDGMGINRLRRAAGKEIGRGRPQTGIEPAGTDLIALAHRLSR